MDFKNVLFLSPHTDDSEIGAGGLMLKLVSSGVNVHHYAFSDCIESIPDGYDNDTLRNEFYSSCDFLGLPSDNFDCFNFKVRNFSSYRQDILEKLIVLRSRIKPDLVVCPSLNDIHQDHMVLACEALRAFKNTNLIHYEMPWNMLNVECNFFVELSEPLIEKKKKLIDCYKSQEHRKYTTGDMVKSIAKIRGAMVSKDYCEMYEVSRWII